MCTTCWLEGSVRPIWLFIAQVCDIQYLWQILVLFLILLLKKENKPEYCMWKAKNTLNSSRMRRPLTASCPVCTLPLDQCVLGQAPAPRDPRHSSELENRWMHILWFFNVPINNQHQQLLQIANSFSSALFWVLIPLNVCKNNPAGWPSTS